jgi:branched-chain amino acid transport system ATP-binding protein
MTVTLLKVKGLQVAYGGIQAVKGIDFEVHEGELVSLIGSNGAGKTSIWAKALWAKALGIWSSRAWPWCQKVAVCSPA